MVANTTRPPGNPGANEPLAPLSAGVLTVETKTPGSKHTDYGERDVPFETEVLQERRQLERCEAEIVYDQTTESIDIVVRKPAAG